MNEKDTYKLIDELIKNSEVDEVNIDVDEKELDRFALENKIDSDMKDRIKKNVKLKIEENIPMNNNHKFKKLMVVASIILAIIISPVAVKAIVEKVYNYIDTTGEVIESSSSIFKLKETITKEVNNDFVTLESFTMNIEKNTIILKIKGIGSRVNKESIVVKVGSEYLKPNSNGLGWSENDWVVDLGFDYSGQYSEETKLSVYIELENGSELNFEPELEKASTVSDYRDLGPWDSINGVEIVGAIKEENQILDINFISSLETNQIQVVDYGDPFNYDRKTDSCNYGIVIKDNSGKEVNGKLVHHGDRMNNFKFDVSDLEKPYKVIIPQIIVSPYGQISNSGNIKIPIPKKNETIEFNKEVQIKRKRDYGVLNENDSFEISKIKRKGEDVSLEIKYAKNNEIVKRRSINLNPMKSIFSKKEYDGYGTTVEEDGISYVLDITPYNINKKSINIDFTDGEFIIYGPWEIEIK